MYLQTSDVVQHAAQDAKKEILLVTVTLYEVGRPTAPISELSGTVLISTWPTLPLHKVSRSLRAPD